MRLLHTPNPNAIWDDDEQRLVSDAEVAEVAFTAFTSRRKADHISARLIVRRVQNSRHGEVFQLVTGWPLMLYARVRSVPG
jgi:hypothetical protein